jgi:hypothetical protein
VPKTYYHPGPGPIDLACGLIVAAGQTTDKADPKQPHDAEHIEQGRLAEIRPVKAPSAQTPEKKEGNQ